MQPKKKQNQLLLSSLQKLPSETILEYVNRALSYKMALEDAGVEYDDDSVVITHIMSGLNQKVWGMVNDLINHTTDADKKISVLLPILTNKEADLALSQEKFGQPRDQQKPRYAMFGSQANRGRGSYSYRGRGRGTQHGRGGSYGGRGNSYTKRCYICNSPDHLIADCPQHPDNKPAPPAPSAAQHLGSSSYRGGRSGHNNHRGGRNGGHSHRGGHTMMHSHAQRERERSPSPKRTRFAEHPAHQPPPPPKSAMRQNYHNWRE
jgi:hypothetical protein